MQNSFLQETTNEGRQRDAAKCQYDSGFPIITDRSTSCKVLISGGLTGLSVRGGKSRQNHGMEVPLIKGLSQVSKATLYEVKSVVPTLCVGGMQCGVKPLFSIREDSFSLACYIRFSRSLLFGKIHARSNETLSKHKVKGIYLLVTSKVWQ